MVHPAPPRPPPWASRVRALLHPAPQSPPQNLPPPPPTKQQAVWSATSPAWPSPWPSASHTCQPSPSSSSSPPSSASPVVLKGISGKKIVTSCAQTQLKNFPYSYSETKFVGVMKRGINQVLILESKVSFGSLPRCAPRVLSIYTGQAGRTSLLPVTLFNYCY